MWSHSTGQWGYATDVDDCGDLHSIILDKDNTIIMRCEQRGEADLFDRNIKLITNAAVTLDALVDAVRLLRLIGADGIRPELHPAYARVLNGAAAIIDRIRNKEYPDGESHPQPGRHVAQRAGEDGG